MTIAFKKDRRPATAEWKRRWKHAALTTGSYLPVFEPFFAGVGKLDPPLTPTQAMLVLNLLSFKWRDAAPFVSYETLGKRMGLSAKMVQRHAKKLERAGYLRIEERRGRSNRFHLDGLFDALRDELARRDQAKRKAAA
jgi:biotin operon repressor